MNKFNLTSNLYPIMQQFCPDGRGLFQVGSTPMHRARRPTEWFGGSELKIMGFLIFYLFVFYWKLCNSYAITFTLTRSEITHFWTDVLDNPINHHHQNLLEEWCFIPSVPFQSALKLFWWPTTLLKGLMLVFPFNLAPMSRYVFTNHTLNCMYSKFFTE